MEYSAIEAEILPQLWKDSKSYSSILFHKDNSKQLSQDYSLEQNNMLYKNIYEFEIKSSKNFGKPISNNKCNNNIDLTENSQQFQKRGRTKKSAIDPNKTISIRDDVSPKLIQIKNPSLTKKSVL